MIPIERFASQYMVGAHYARFRAALDSVLRPLRPLAYAAGHDHDLQVIAGGSPRYFLIAGAGWYGESDRARWLDSTRFATKGDGYMRLDALSDGRVRLGVRLVDSTGAWREAYADWIESPFVGTRSDGRAGSRQPQ